MTNPDSAASASPAAGAALTLAHGLAFEDLYAREGLMRLDRAYIDTLRAADPALAARLLDSRQDPNALDAKAESALLLELAPHLENFIADLFGVAGEAAAATRRHEELAPIYAIKRQFVQRRASARIKPELAESFDGPALERGLRRLFGGKFDELTYAQHVTRWLEDETRFAREIELALHYAAWTLFSAAGREHVRSGVLFKAPLKTDAHNLLAAADKVELYGATSYRIRQGHLRRREGFRLTDGGASLTLALDQAHYCIECHPQGKDSCSRGLREKAPAAAPATVSFKKSALGVTLAGCPLEEKISEFLALKARGLSVAALATIVIDNPMAAATGHRICNDCMKSCIYQKQEPVNIPQAETRTLRDVLALPWGFEIYSLLTRWNPLNLRRPLPLPATGYRVLVVGMGPAGFGLAHQLLNEGHTVVGIEGLKIEPLPEQLSGVRIDGSRVPFMPVRDAMNLYEPLEERTQAGFGGVAEYGITARWDKNFLKLIRLVLERRDGFAMFGGVRLGSTLTLQDALDLGFDHVALAMGAGKPTTLDVPNGLARGVRTASDFLMSLQLTGAARRDSIANMQMRLPVVVIGGGLTAIDTATEALAYYVVQVEKFLVRYEALAAQQSEDAVRDRWDPEEREVAEEFLSHARAIRSERRKAAAEGRAARIAELVQHWGGAIVAYRRRLVDSPSYTLNHEEVEKALEEGVQFAEGLTPIAIDVDDYGAANAVRFRCKRADESGALQDAGELRLPACTVFIAAGTQPNTVLAREDAPHFPLDGKYFRACDESGQPVKPEPQLAKTARADVLLTKLDDGRFISFFGDLHPSYFGNVVKALGSVKQGYPVVSRVLAQRAPASQPAAREFFAALNRDLRASVHRVTRLTPTIVEVVINAPAAARRFQPGQFYRLQNFEALSPVVAGTRMQMEGMALTGAWVDREAGLVSTIVLEMGGSSDLCARLKPGEPVVLMGPTGAPTHIAAGETVLLAGGGLGNAVLFSIGQALREAGSKVLYFAGYKKVIDRYKVTEIEAAADAIIWCCDEAPGFEPQRPQDFTFIGNIVQAMEAYASGRLGEPRIHMQDVDRIVAIGSDRMMAAVGRARHAVLKPYLKATHFAIGSINSPMQCMMKEICAQCLQPQHDPVSGETSYVFSCFNQDQELDRVDFHALSERLKQNSLQEKLTALWIRNCLHAPVVRGAGAAD